MKRFLFFGLVILFYASLAFATAPDRRLSDSDGDVLDLNSDGTVPISINGEKLVYCDTFTTAGIEACFDTLGSDGGKVVLLEGTYTAATTIDLPSRVALNLTIEGSGRGTIIDCTMTDGTDCISLVGPGAAAADRARGLEIKSFYMQGASGGGDLLHIENYRDVVVENMWLMDAGAWGMYIDSGQGRFIKNWVHNAASGGMFVDDMHNGAIIGNQMDFCEGPGLQVRDTYEVMIAENSLEYNDDANMYILGQPADVIPNNPGALVNNEMSSVGSSANNVGLKIENGYRWLIVGNQIGSNADDGIYALDSHHLIINNNYIFYNVGVGIDLDNVSHSTFHNNYIYTNSDNVISEDANCHYNSITSGLAGEKNDDIRYGDAQQIDTCETAWTAETNVTSTRETNDGRYLIQGSYGCKHVVGAAFTTGLMSSYDISSLDLTKWDKVGLWVRSSSGNVAANVYQLVLDESSGCGSPEETLNIPALTDDDWKYVELTLSDPSVLDAVVCVGVKAASDPGAATLFMDDIKTEHPKFQYDSSTGGLLLMPEGQVGNIGVNTTAPQEKLHIFGADGVSRRLEIESDNASTLKLTTTSGSWGVYSQPGQDALAFYDYTDTTDRMAINGDGNVGIGTWIPVDRLQVVGGGLLPNRVTSDPCGSYAIGSIFYNLTSNYHCYCNGAGADIKMNDNSTACF